MDMFIEYLKVFMLGGFLCLIAQLLIDFTDLTPAKILSSYVVAGVILGALGLYEPLLDFAESGASVPLTGFGNLLAKGVREAVEEKGLFGIFSGGLSAGAAGICAAMFFGLGVALIFRSKDEK